eukprot:TRINITY_DN9514_c0_g1_i4.p1 TRINITY_DN9514_c0_g1~~TRINITY_DN9514_c0_g1_i4.p1  ORF type:complete len:105 (+),score=16.40 TRINITY_DN9514_c0_g1_i4:351-665(+)
MNKALLGNWLWRIGDGSERLWIKVLEWKYKLPRHRWDVQEAPKESSATWKGILSVRRLFMENMRYQTQSGEKILFWKDRWTGERTPSAQFPYLFRCVKEATASS